MPTPRALALTPLLLLAACATQSAAAVAPAAPGFLLGLWHGFIFPIAWLVSLFVSEVSVFSRRLKFTLSACLAGSRRAVPNSQTPARRLTGWSAMPFATASFLGIVVFGVGARKSTRIVYRERVVGEKPASASHRIVDEEG